MRLGLSQSASLQRYLLVLAVLLLLTPALQAANQRFFINHPDDFDMVTFESDAKLEFIEGETHDLHGWFDFDPHAPGQLTGKAWVDLRTLETGIELRDEHMRERHLETDECPFALIEINSVGGLPPDLLPDSSYVCEVGGEFTIHGVTKPLQAAAQVVAGPPGVDGRIETLDASVRFSIQLDDYEIPRPRALFLKLAETINVEVRFIASPEFDPVEWNEEPPLD